jgi:predicted nucleic acid-binding protein
MRETLAYFDTSVVVKRYVSESGSAAARRLLRRHATLSSVLMPVELLSALRRRRARGELSAAELAALLRDLREDRAYWWLLDIDARVLTRAELLLQDTALRTLDALHVAAAQVAAPLCGSPLSFITADRRQRDAASRAGFDVIWVE